MKDFKKRAKRERLLDEKAKLMGLKGRCPWNYIKYNMFTVSNGRFGLVDVNWMGCEGRAAHSIDIHCERPVQLGIYLNVLSWTLIYRVMKYCPKHFWLLDIKCKLLWSMCYIDISQDYLVSVGTLRGVMTCRCLWSPSIVPEGNRGIVKRYSGKDLLNYYYYY
jgi:hypothetical protein